MKVTSSYYERVTKIQNLKISNAYIFIVIKIVFRQ